MSILQEAELIALREKIDSTINDMTRFVNDLDRHIADQRKAREQRAKQMGMLTPAERA